MHSRNALRFVQFVVAAVGSVHLDQATGANLVSSSPSVATISPRGTTAPQPVATVTLSATSTSMYVGQSQTISVTLKDAQGNTLTGRTIAWSSSNGTALTVSPSGTLQAVGVGSATVTATSEGKSASVTITVAAAPVAPVASVSVTASSTSLTVGQTTQAVATPRDGHGTALTGKTATWTSSAPNVASVSGTGVVTAVAGGQAMINATIDGVVGSLGITVQSTSAPPPPPPPPDTSTVVATLAELPRSVPAPTFAKATRVVRVTRNLQSALDAAQPGDSLVLSGTFTGNFVLPSRSCGAGITVTSAASLPSAGTRVTPTSAASFAKIITPNGQPALKTQNPTCGWRLVGLDIAASAGSGVIGVSVQYGILWLGDGGWVAGGETQTSLAAVPQQILLDRVYLHGATTTNSTRCLLLNSGNTVIRDSWISECHVQGFDAQAILGCNGPGPYLIENNEIAGSTENILFGGCDPAAPEMIPADITIRRNHIYKDPTWKGGVWVVKNLVELKNARRVLIEANVMDSTWIAAQAGMAIVIKSTTDVCRTGCMWEGTTDVTIRHNIIRGSHRGLNLQAYDNSYVPTGTDVHVQRVTVENNLFTSIGTANGIAPSDGWLMLLTHDLKDIRIRHNTFVSNTSGYGFASYFAAATGDARRIDISDNVFAGQSYYSLASDAGQLHRGALTAFAGTSWRFIGNVVSQVNQEYWTLNPSGNSYTDRVANLGLASDGSLASTSPYRSRATDGTDPGANIADVMTRTRGVVVAP